MKRHLITISGQIGAGKSTLAMEVVARLKDACLISLDCYDDAATYHVTYRQKGGDPVDAIREWARNGGDPDDYVHVPQLTRDIITLMHGAPITLPNPMLTGETQVKPARFIILEEPFGRERRDMRKLVDLAIHIDLPLDLSLARYIKRSVEDYGEPVQKVLQNYLDYTREICLRLQKVSLSADLVVDGTRPAAANADQVAEAVWERFGKAGDTPAHQV